MTQASAPGKIVLFGEHSVVYGQPAIAAPVFGVKSTTTIKKADEFSIQLMNQVKKEKAMKAIKLTVENTLQTLNQTDANFKLNIDSQVPIASGMGSGAAVGVSVIRAMSKYFQKDLSNQQISEIDYKTEQFLHTHPSGIDNTVIAHEQAILFQKGKMQPITIGKPMLIMIANTGIRSSTKAALEHVHNQWEKDPEKYETYFEKAGRIAREGKKAIEKGQLERIGQLMTEFQEFYRQIDMSHPENEKLVQAALDKGALGSKISGKGRGGCVIALTEEENRETIRNAWKKLEPEVIIETTIK